MNSSSGSLSSSGRKRTKAERLQEQKLKRRAQAKARRGQVESKLQNENQTKPNQVSGEPLMDRRSSFGEEKKPKSGSSKIERKTLPPVRTPNSLSAREPFTEMDHLTATHIQAQYRGYAGKKQYEAEQGRQRKIIRQEVKQELSAEREMAAVMLQSTYRGHKGRSDAQQLEFEEQRYIEETLRLELEEEELAATHMQRLARGKMSRTQAYDRRIAEEDVVRREIQAEIAEEKGSRSYNQEENDVEGLPPATPTNASVGEPADILQVTEEHVVEPNWRAVSKQPGSQCLEATSEAKAEIRTSPAKSLRRGLWQDQGLPPGAVSQGGTITFDPHCSRISSDKDQVLADIQHSNGIRVLSVTWNLHAKDGPIDMKSLFPRSRYHIYAVGTEECQRSIAKSVVFTKKKQWENKLKDTLGPDYTMLKAHALQAIHLVVFCHVALLPMVTAVESSAVATGIADTLGNKGGIGVGFRLGRTSMLFVNCHLTAHQHKAEDRNADVAKIEKGLGLPRGKDAANKGLRRDHAKKTTDRYDQVIWMGDLNYRVDLERKEVDDKLQQLDLAALHEKDQLKLLMQQRAVFAGFAEGEIRFPPTYKLDAGTLNYDSSKKQRIPSWTDRVLYKPNDAIKLTSYNCCKEYQTSDHLPVYATFDISPDTEHHDEDNYQKGGKGKKQKFDQTQSQVCLIS